MNEKLHNILRTLQWLIPEIVALYGVLDNVFGWGVFGIVETVAFAIVGFIGNVVQHSSKKYFSDHDIVPKE